MTLYHANIDYARRSTITGNSYNGTSVSGGRVDIDIFTETHSDSYLQFDLHRPALLKLNAFQKVSNI